MTALAPIRPKLAALIPRLASQFDGEVVGTTRAIERVLKAAGLDLHVLAREVGEEPTPILVHRDRPAASVVGPPAWADLDRNERLLWLEVVKVAPWPSDWDRSFAADWWAKLWAGPSRGPSPKQEAHLNRLVAQAWARGERP